MGMSTHICGFKPPDDKWKKMKAVYDACEKAGIPAPDEVLEFFGDEEPDSKGVQISQTDLGAAVKEWNDKDMCEGYEVDVTKLPSDVKIIRFWNSY